MSRASNSLKISDVTATPIKLKYSASYSNTTISNTGIYAQSGLNGPVTVTGSIPQRTLRYWSIRHLYYSNFLTGSYLSTTSSFDNSLQSTAASGTFEGNTIASASADVRYFPTESNAKIKIINIPKSSFGEKTSRKSFFLNSTDGTSFQLVDDGNGNVVDILNSNIHVGNIIYPQGFVIITNPDYYCVMDGGPFTFAKSYIFDISTNPKTFTPILGAIPDCAPVDSSSLTLLPYPGFSFPSNSIGSNGLVTLSESDTLTNKVGIYKEYYTMKSTYSASSDKQPITVQITDCAIGGLSVTLYSAGVSNSTVQLRGSTVGVSVSSLAIYYDLASSIGTLIPALDTSGNRLAAVTRDQLLAGGILISVPNTANTIYAYSIGSVCNTYGTGYMPGIPTPTPSPTPTPTPSPTPSPLPATATPTPSPTPSPTPTSTPTPTASPTPTPTPLPCDLTFVIVS